MQDTTNQNPYVNLMGEYLARAMTALMQGDVSAAATLTRIAYGFEQQIPDSLRFKQ
jgi:hypothetical protein